MAARGLPLTATPLMNEIVASVELRKVFEAHPKPAPVGEPTTEHLQVEAEVHPGGQAEAPRCAMLTGVAAGVMELVYGEGTIEERYGTFAAEERRCVACGEGSCNFAVSRVE